MDGTLPLGKHDFDWFRELVYREAGISLADGKKTMVAARLSRRVRDLGLASLAEYAQHLSVQQDGVELGEFINCLTTNKTDFFREAHHFDYLARHVFPEIRARAAQGGPHRLHIWSAGCSTGEEPYSLAMTVRDHFGSTVGWDVRILATDIDTQVLAAAQAGAYDDERIKPLPEATRRRHFHAGRRDPRTGSRRWTARPELTTMIEFAQVNLNDSHWQPRGPFDAIFCRNVIIYFDQATQRRLFGRLASCLNPEGYLFLGHSESMIGGSERFSLMEKTVHRLLPVGPARAARTRRSTPAAGKATAPAHKPARHRPASHRAARARAKRIIIGEVFASREPAVVGTLLGSCVSACLFDPEARVGGMNHFLLPTAGSSEVSARYGVHAMEVLINEIQSLGGDRRRLVAKVFGGARVLARNSSDVAEQNALFVRRFLALEQIPILAERLGGTQAIEVWFHTATGRARMRYIAGQSPQVLAEEKSARERLKEADEHPEERVTLF
jgi:chemotaxis protein methyltransferase CheR